MPDYTIPPADFGRERQRRIYLGGVAGRAPRVPIDPAALEKAARKAMSREAFAYIAGGAGMESTMAANRAAMERWRIIPRMLRDVEVRDTSVELFGRRLPAPLLLAPIGVLEMAHPEADLAVARAAASLGVPMIFSNQASVPMETCAAAMGSGPRWFQLYWSRSDVLVRSLVARAEGCGCEAIVLTLDTTMLGWRTRDLDLAYLPFLRGKGIAQYTSDPTFLSSLSQPLPDTPAESPAPINFRTLRTFAQMVRRHPGRFVANLRSGVPRRSVQRFVATYSRPSLTWEHLDHLRGLTRLPIVLKGIQHPDDARMAVERGMDGVVVSNHGGRQVDGAIGSLGALPAIADAVAGRIPVLFDSGIRGGADVFRALALGATAVCLGRPYAYGLAIAGVAGVHEVIENLRADFDLTMGLAGCARVAEITRDAVTRV
jgi:lactate 2-monooxygenase